MVDLPGITRVPVHGQPDNIYEQIQKIIMEYITPKESIILNVISATVDFSTSESIRMSQMVDRTRERTLAVVTKADMHSEGLLEKVTADDVRIGLGYICVRNRIGDERYEKARSEEVALFQSHPVLSKIDRSMVGIPILDQRLTRIQASSIARCLPSVVEQINDKLKANMGELNKLPGHLSSAAEAMNECMMIISSVKESLKKIMIQGEYGEYMHEKEMHCTARLSEMIDEFSEKLLKIYNCNATECFLMEEIEVLEEAKGIRLPNFIPRAAFVNIMQKKIGMISSIPDDFVDKVWSYVDEIVVSIVTNHSEDYPLLRNSLIKAARNVIIKIMDESMIRVKELIEMEKLADYTSNPEYMTRFNKLMGTQSAFNKAIESKDKSVSLDEIGDVYIEPLRKHKEQLQAAFDMKMRVLAYWKIVIRRVVDSMALHLILHVYKLVDKELEKVVVRELLAGGGDGGVERLFEESPGVAGKREWLKKSIELLKESKNVVAYLIDNVAVGGSS